MAIEYLHPHISSRIIDNSTTFVTAQGQTYLFAAFKAPKGPDNRIGVVTSPSEFSFTYGSPHMRRYGQQAYNVMRWLESGGAAYCVRVLPYLDEDEAQNPIQPSTYSAVIVEVGVQVDDTTGDTSLRRRIRTLGDGQNTEVTTEIESKVRDDQSLRAISLYTVDDTTVAESDGFTYYPVMVIRSKDRGEYFNDFGIDVAINSDQDDTYEHRLYDFTVFSSPSRVDQTLTASFDPDAIDTNGAPQFIETVFEENSSTIRVLVNEDNWEAVATAINSDPTVLSKIDILFNQEREIAGATETLHAAVTVDETSDDFSSSELPFTQMAGGTDGDWVDGNSLESLLYNAFSGSGDEIDPNTGNNVYDTHFGDILNKDRYEIDVILDANYTPMIKNAISTAAVTRGDYVSILDTGFTSTYSQALKKREDDFPVNTFHSAIYTQDFTVDDPYNGGVIRVTPTWFLAQKIPGNDATFGMHYALAGPKYGSISEFKDISWVPDTPHKEALYKARLNYIERDSMGTRFGSHSTSQYMQSALSALPNVRSLLRLRRELHKFARMYQFDFNRDTVWADASEELNALLGAKVNRGIFRTASGSVYASDQDRRQNIMRVLVEVTYHGFIERVMIDIAVNK